MRCALREVRDEDLAVLFEQWAELDAARAQLRMIDVSIETKRNVTPVTDAHRAIERALRERVAPA